MPAPDPFGISIATMPDGGWSITVERFLLSGVTQRKARALRVLANLRRDGWACCACGGPIPEYRRADARYCREGCRKRAARVRCIAMQKLNRDPESCRIGG